MTNSSNPCRRFAAFFSIVAMFLAVASGCGPTAATNPNAPQNRADLPANLTTITGYVGGEKLDLLQNEKIRRILAQKYQIAVNPIKEGSITMVNGSKDLTGKDFLWPSNGFAVELFRHQGGKSRTDQIVFNSPIVIYTGWNIANALTKLGIVEKRPEGYFIVKFKELLTMIVERKQWKDIGLDFFGKISIRSTDPTKSNSGNMFAGLVANTLAGDVVDEDTVDSVLPQTKRLFARLGFMEGSSADIFRNFLATGTRNSMVVGYESQIVEFIAASPDKRDMIQDQVCVLYPEPTVWSSHPIISLSDRGDILIKAMLDPEVQKLAWSEHGFRSGLPGINADKSAVGLPCIAEKIAWISPLPGEKAFMKILDALKEL